MPDLDLDALTALAEAATPGPWVASDPHPFQPGAQIRLYGRDWTPIRMEEASERHVRPTADAYYIVAAQPTNLLALIARVRAAEAERDAAGAERDDYREALTREAQQLAQATIHASQAVGSVSLDIGREMVKLGYPGMRERAEKAEAEVTRLRAAITAALDWVRPGSSVPLGVTEARHRLLAETHRILTAALKEGATGE